MEKANMKIIILLTFLALFGSIYYLFIMDNREYYTQVVDEKVEIQKEKEKTRYQYILKSYNKNGRKKELKFKTTKRYLEGAYLKITVKWLKKVDEVKEVRYEELPSIVINKMNIERIPLPEIEKIKSVVLIENNKKKNIESKNSIKEIITILKQSNLTTKESIRDTPINTEELITINFLFEEGETTMFIYKKNSKYYVEQPYNAIYSISSANYQKIREYSA